MVSLWNGISEKLSAKMCIYIYIHTLSVVRSRVSDFGPQHFSSTSFEIENHNQCTIHMYLLRISLQNIMLVFFHRMEYMLELQAVYKAE